MSSLTEEFFYLKLLRRFRDSAVFVVGSSILLHPVGRMPEPDCFLRYRMRCNSEFYYVRKIPRTGIGRPSLQRRVVLKWFYSPRAVGTPLSQVGLHVLHRVRALLVIIIIIIMFYY